MRALPTRLRPRGVLWPNRDFLWLWTAQTVSQFGSEITGLALPLVAILVLEASTFEVAVLAVVDWLPFVLFSLIAGVWVDRLPRRLILIAADWGRAIALGTIPLAYLLDVLTLGQLYVVGLTVGTLTLFFELSYQSYLPSLVNREELSEGNSKLEISRSGAQVAGPGLAGLLVSALTAPYAILFDAISFVASGLSLLRIRHRAEKPVQHDHQRPSFRTEISEGLRYTLRNPIQRAFIVFVAPMNLFSNMLFAIYLVYAVRVLDLTPTLIGIIFSIGSVGSLIGALTANRSARRFGIGRSLIVAATIGGCGMLFIPLATGDLVIPFLVLASFAYGFFVLNYFVTGVSLVQATTPDHLLGRTNASRRFVVQSMIPVGALLGGALGTVIGLRPTIAIGAVGAALSVVTLFLSPLPRIRVTADADELVRPLNERFALSAGSP